MGKKQKAKKARALETSNDTMSAEESPKIDYHRPLSSPYAAPLLTLVIGNNRYGLPESFLRKYPQFPPRSPFSSTITLQGVHEDAGHSLVHFLYSGNYETIKSPLKPGISEIAREYRISALVYEASRKYGLAELEALAGQYIQRFGEELSLADILRETRDIFSKYHEDETWFLDFIRGELQRMLNPSQLAGNLGELYEGLGQNDRFDNMVLKTVVEILSDRLRSLPEDKDILLGDKAVYENEDLARKVEGCAEEVYEDEVHGEEAYEEAAPAEEVCEAYEDAAPAEEVHEDEVPAEGEVYEEAAPTEGVHEDEVPAEGEVYEEAAPTEGVHEDEAPAETCDEVPAQNALAPTVKLSAKDLALYQDWDSLTSLRRRKRVKKLTSRGLPIPNEDGSISISMT